MHLISSILISVGYESSQDKKLQCIFIVFCCQYVYFVYFSALESFSKLVGNSLYCYNVILTPLFCVWNYCILLIVRIFITWLLSVIHYSKLLL